MKNKIPFLIIGALCFGLGLISNQFSFVEFMGLSIVTGLIAALFIKYFIIKNQGK